MNIVRTHGPMDALHREVLYTTTTDSGWQVQAILKMYARVTYGQGGQDWRFIHNTSLPGGYVRALVPWAEWETLTAE